MTVRIVTDSTCDLPAAFVDELGITVVPLTIEFDGESLRDGVDIDAAGFYRRLAESPALPRTSQPSTESFVGAYESLAAADGIVSIHISSKLSGTLNSAMQGAAARAGGPPVEFVDSRFVALGLGAIVVEAARVANEGAGLAAVAAAARDAIARVDVVAMVDTLEYLRRGGRIGRASTWLGSMLSVKPLIAVKEGEVVPFARVRTRARAIDRLVEFAETQKGAPLMFVAGTGAPDQTAALVERLAPLLPGTRLIEGDLGPAVGVHAGPGALGVAPLRAAP
jgi:DegV family protein with EDD domain